MHASIVPISDRIVRIAGFSCLALLGKTVLGMGHSRTSEMDHEINRSLRISISSLFPGSHTCHTASYGNRAPSTVLLEPVETKVLFLPKNHKALLSTLWILAAEMSLGEMIVQRVEIGIVLVPVVQSVTNNAFKVRLVHVNH
jgi:hypothetical protein